MNSLKFNGDRAKKCVQEVPRIVACRGTPHFRYNEKDHSRPTFVADLHHGQGRIAEIIHYSEREYANPSQETWHERGTRWRSAMGSFLVSARIKDQERKVERKRFVEQCMS